MSGLAYQFLNNKKKAKMIRHKNCTEREKQLKLGYQKNFLKGSYGKTSVFNMWNWRKLVYPSILESSTIERFSVDLFRYCTSSTTMNQA